MFPPTGLRAIHTRLFIVEDVFNEYIPLQMHECYLVTIFCYDYKLCLSTITFEKLLLQYFTHKNSSNLTTYLAVLFLALLR